MKEVSSSAPTIGRKETAWKKIITSKRYLQGPFAGYICTQWPDFKIIVGKNALTPKGERPVYSKFPASGLFILDETGHPFDFVSTEMLTRDDGAPIHKMVNKQAGFSLFMENFCETEVINPAVFTKFTVTNTSDENLEKDFTVIFRSGFESYMSGTEVAGYASYNSSPENWGMLQRTWGPSDKSAVTDGQMTVKVLENTGFDLSWHKGEPGDTWVMRDNLHAHISLKANESAEIKFVMAFNDSERTLGSYEEECEKQETYWASELKRIKKYPAREGSRAMVNNLVIQCLQFIATYIEEGFTAPRQGGLDRNIWAGESVEFITMLDRIGDFKRYTDSAIDFFTGYAMKETGEISLPTAWASTTGCAMRSAGYHVKHTDKAQFDKYRDKMYKAFKWMEEMRAKSYEDPDCKGKGIFPLGKGNDWPVVDQNWCITDGHNLTGYKELAEAFEMYKDPAATEIRAAYEDYLSHMKEILADEFAKNTDPDEFLMTNRIGKVQTDPPMGAYFGDGPAMLIMADVMDPKSRECYMAEQYFINRGMFHDGLTGLMSDNFLRPGRPVDHWAGHLWYLSSCDSRWFKAYMIRGEKEKALQTLNADINYGMTDAYYMPERIADNDFTFTPYMPNASANGRTIHMLFDYYGEEK